MNAVLSPTSPTQPPVAHKMKHCSACETDHPIPDFAINGHSSRQSQCKLARRRYISAHYERNRLTHIARVSARGSKLRSQLYASLMALPRPSKCAACNKALPTKKNIAPRERPVALLAAEPMSPSVNRLIHDTASMARIEAAMEAELTWVHRSCIARLRTNVATP
jgi:hypothetical protein